MRFQCEVREQINPKGIMLDTSVRRNSSGLDGARTKTQLIRKSRVKSRDKLNI